MLRSGINIVTFEENRLVDGRYHAFHLVYNISDTIDGSWMVNAGGDQIRPSPSPLLVASCGT